MLIRLGIIKEWSTWSTPLGYSKLPPYLEIFDTGGNAFSVVKNGLAILTQKSFITLSPWSISLNCIGTVYSRWNWFTKLECFQSTETHPIFSEDSDVTSMLHMLPQSYISLLKHTSIHLRHVATEGTGVWVPIHKIFLNLFLWKFLKEKDMSFVTNFFLYFLRQHSRYLIWI